MKSAKELLDCRAQEQKLNQSSTLTRTVKPIGSEEEEREIQNARENLYALLSECKVSVRGEMCQSYWDRAEGAIILKRITGKLRKHMGYIVSRERRLHPEEALFLMNSGSLELTTNGGSVPLSFEQAMCLFGANLNFNGYLVYAHLSRAGYLVVRHVENTYSPSDKAQCAKSDARAQKNSSKMQESLTLSEKRTVGNGSMETTTELEKCADFLNRVQKFVENSNQLISNRMNVDGLKAAWFPREKSSYDSEKRVKFGENSPNFSLLECFPDNQGGCLTHILPLPDSCFPFPVSWRPGELILSDSRNYTQAPLSSFGTKRRKLERRDFGRTSNWVFVHPRILRNSANWSEYKNARDKWLNRANRDDTVTEYLWKSEDKVTPLVPSNFLTTVADADLRKKLEIFAVAERKEDEKNERNLGYTFDVHLPESGYCISTPTVPKMRIVVLDKSAELPSHQLINKLKMSYDDNAETCVAVVSGAAIQFFVYSDSFSSKIEDF